MSGGPSVNVVVVDRDAMTRGSIKKYLGSLGVRVVGETESLASGLSLVNGLRPDVLILDLSAHTDQTLEAVRGLKNEMPDMGIILTATDAPPQLILRAMRVGAQEFLTRPIDNRELGEAINRLSGMMRRSAAPKRRSGKIVTVFSGKGGVGVTSLATNLAVSFARNCGKRTAVVDLNMQMGDVGLMLDLRPEYTITDAIGTGSLDESRLKGLMTEHESGVHLLSTPEDPVESEKISPGLLLEVFSLLKSMYDVIVVDAGHFFDSRVLEVLSLADTILVMASLDVPTVRNVRRCLTLFDQLGYTQEKVKIIVNRHQKRSKVTAEDLEETAETKIFWSIPNDYKPLIASIDSGVPAIIQSPKSKVSRAIEDLSHELIQMYGDDEVEEDAEETEPKPQTASR